jgi:plasmid stabilization system protein ParE
VAESRSVEWTDRALGDVEAAYLYFFDRSRDYAERFLLEVEHAADSLSHFSKRGRVVPEVALPNVRELIVESHRMVYRVEADKVVIVRLIHGRRDFKSSWKSRP